MKQQPARHPIAVVILHWLIAALLLLALAMGTFVLKEIPNTSPEKLGALRGHIVIGFAISGLMLLRLLVRWRTLSPAPALTGNQALNLLGKAPRLVHGWIAKLLVLLVGLHVLGVVYHQLFLKDRLLSRMTWGK